MVMFQLIKMSSYATKKLQMCSVMQHQFRRRQMCGNFSQIHKGHSIFICYKKWVAMAEQSEMFQLINMSYYAKNKLQMCSVT